VPSNSTVFRAFHEITPAVRDGLGEATAEVLAKVWARSPSATGDGPVYLDIDATLVEVHSENKDQTGPTYKGGFGFHPMFCFADATGEATYHNRL
jgi:Transposase DDE domain group 1